MELKNSISWNIRRFLRVGVFFFWALNVPVWGFHFPKYKKTFLFRIYEKFFRGFRFLKYKTFSGSRFFYFSISDRKVQGSISAKCKKMFFEKIKEKASSSGDIRVFFNIRARTFQFWKYKKFFGEWIVLFLVGWAAKCAKWLLKPLLVIHTFCSGL